MGVAGASKWGAGSRLVEATADYVQSNDAMNGYLENTTNVRATSPASRLLAPPRRAQSLGIWASDGGVVTRLRVGIVVGNC
jgi:hypothetical protein